ncbi:MAG: hypothetical protein KAV42_10090 [Candidatus Krumholzibacteria bacterium]|nr:hypothetical protein [Candidatus Krumholzibacteria bacterium]
MDIAVRREILSEEFDYQTIMHALGDHVYPRGRISALIRGGDIVRVKKGIYVFGEQYRERPYSREVLANIIYGPSYISLEYAMGFYGMIPESVEGVTSVTTGRSRRFETPVGLFSYRSVPAAAFSVGIDRMETRDGKSFLIALPEKALADKIRLDHGSGISSQRELKQYLIDSLRIDPATLAGMNAERVEEYSALYRSRKIGLLAKLLHRGIGRGGRWK